MINTINPHNPDRCPGNSQTNLNFRADRNAISKGPEVRHEGGRYFRTIVAARVKLDTTADDNAGSRVFSYHRVSRHFPVPKTRHMNPWVYNHPYQFPEINTSEEE
jgi:hypothetical protein